tara:strand:- start:3963 stop:5858 length:1896 start_codon:yes stop_codon:yes gene_type:complete
MTLDIVKLIENNPIVSLSEKSNDKLLKKIKENFNEEDQKLFLSSFYCFFKYDPFKDFVIDLDEVWSWIGFSRKSNAKTILEKYFKKEIDYKVFAAVLTATKKGSGGHNSLKTLMSVNTFKSLCLKANTSKASQIHDYYMKIEKIMHETLHENQSELLNQIALLKNEKEEYIKSMQEKADEEFKKSKLMADKAAEKATILQFPLNTECVYIGTFTHDGRKHIKYGQTNNLNQRVRDHRKFFGDFILVNAFKVQNKVEIENLIRHDKRVKPFECNVEVNGKVYKEILVSEGPNYISVDDLSKIVNDIIKSRSYNIDNFNRILLENEKLFAENNELRFEVKKHLQTIEEQRCEIETAYNKIKLANISKLEAEDKMVKIQECVAPDNEYDRNNVKEAQDDEFRDWIYQHCILQKDAEVCGREISGWFRITKQNKDGKVTDKFRDHLKFNFKQGRLKKQENRSVTHGYWGITLKDIDHTSYNVEPETPIEKALLEFIEKECILSPKAKILMTDLTKNFSGKSEFSNSDDTKKKIINYLKKRNDVFYSPLSFASKSGLGFYGLCLKGELDSKPVPTTSKSVEKVCAKSQNVLQVWNSVTDAGLAESIHRSTLCRAINTQRIFKKNGDEYFFRNTSIQ